MALQFTKHIIVIFLISKNEVRQSSCLDRQAPSAKGLLPWPSNSQTTSSSFSLSQKMKCVSRVFLERQAPSAKGPFPKPSDSKTALDPFIFDCLYISFYYV
jgi:hypothetical protein